jgi:GAF domain-containing protein
MTLNSKEALPPDTDERLESFTELVATAIANAESREALARLAEEQAALRRVATLVARDAPSTEVFDAWRPRLQVARHRHHRSRPLRRRRSRDGNRKLERVSCRGVPVGTRSAVGGHNVLTIVAETGEPARVDGYDDATGEAAEIARRHGWRSSIAAPIVVEVRLWGVMLVATQRPGAVSHRCRGTAGRISRPDRDRVANTQAHDELRRFGDEQAALGRVATLVAAGAAPEQVFTAVVEEVSSLLGLERIELVRYRQRQHRDRDRRVGRASIPGREHLVARRPERDGDGRADEGAARASTTTGTWMARSPARHEAQAFNRRSAHRSPSKGACGA